MTTAFISHPDCQLHEMGAGHPESPQRLQAIERQLDASDLRQRLDIQLATPVEVELLYWTHGREFVREIEALLPSHGLAWADPDTALNPHSLGAAHLAAGAVVQAAKRVLAGQVDNAFCAIRPPGHHAEQERAMGFCLFNNVAVGVEWALREGGAERVAVLDFDVHHGNGTVDIFQDRPEVLVCSSFQYPFYPFRYQDIRRPNIVHTPLPAGTASDEFRLAVEADWLPALRRHRPDIIFVSAGFDAHREDPLAQLRLEDADFRWITDLIVDASKPSAGGRIVSVLEGGYSLQALGRSVEQHLEGLLEA
ncbi:histone deacetylase family protein [Marinobacterium aestuariivivens]|uniref:Histone deacetylase family protein n=1 Tax=Marinobacterium aestuariivivens TaxID=1698799 RepID=A0ABW2A777_9GAMM